MTRITLYTPPDDNRTLKAARIIASTDRQASSAAYATVSVGVAQGTPVDYYGTYDGSEVNLLAASPLQVVSSPVRLSRGRAVVAEVAVVGSALLAGLSVQVEIGHVLTMPAHNDADRALLDGVAGFLKETASGDQVFTVPLADVASLTSVKNGVFHARLSRASATQLSLAAYGGQYVEVAGTMVDVSTALTLTTSDGLINAAGAQTATTPAASATLYGVYLSAAGTLRLSTTATPTTVSGVPYLTAAGSDWRFVGWVKTNATPNFVDTVASRLVINYYNKRPLTGMVIPAYADADSQTTYTTTSTTFTKANGGTGATVEYISNGEDAVDLYVAALMQNSAGNNTIAGIGDNSSTAAVVEALHNGTGATHPSCRYSSTPAAGFREAHLLVRVSGGTGTYYADDARGGSAADPYATYLIVRVMG